MWGLDESTCFAGFAAHSLPYLPLQARYSGPLYTCLIYMIGMNVTPTLFHVLALAVDVSFIEMQMCLEVCRKL